MKRIVPLLWLLFIACENAIAPQPPKTADTPAKISEKKLPEEKPVALPPGFLDTLTKYKGRNKIIESKLFHFYSGKTEGIYFSIVPWDTLVFVYQLTDHIWTKTDSARYYGFFGGWTENIRVTDLNGDKKKDLVVVEDFTGAGANEELVVFLYDPQTRQFHHYSDFDLPNIWYDAKKNLVCSAWWGSVTWSQTKWTYKPTGHQLTFVEGVRYRPNPDSLEGPSSIEWFHKDHDKEVIFKSDSGKVDKMWRIFERAVWDSRNFWN